ncbi:glycosyltransferase family 4 protein [Thiohalophilus thiocyanatoxydans]|uniref:Glycosyltransferase involved in cell wall biosynthesis n=1 Tax=Thiohalophilus thiocyanatoxydans TaxID=381308 RepID=A0A4R8IQU2_9GAMM|nr:glycosyltransferase family 4 protein [Thiohalophilus thiocyanatoxydans]TDY02684.1 glycosyltransferase involved in cell wall biosynthesis [Thiohalophilus thiocyanatoxydans]
MADIVIVFDSGFGGGGAERVALHLVDYWIKQGRTVQLVTMRGPEHDFYTVPSNAQRIVLGGTAKSRNKIFGLLNNIPRVLRLRSALVQSDAQIILAFQTRTNIRTILACFGSGKRVIISERNDPSRQLFGWPWPWLRRMLYRYADIVTANSQIALEYMRDYVPGHKLTYVPNPVVVPDSSAHLKQSTKILNVSSLKSHKGQELLIEAIALLGEGLGGWTVDLLGEGPERNNLNSLVYTHSLQNRVLFHGLVDDPSPFYLSAGIFVFPSTYEGTPNALLEAMAFGLPCIVSDSLPGALEHIEDGVTGLVFRNGDTSDLAEKIQKLIEDVNLRINFGSAARESMKVLASKNQMMAWDSLLKPSGRQ